MRYISVVVLMMLSWLSFAQDNSLLDRMCSEVASSCVIIDYSYTARVSGIDNKASGSLMSQGENWVVQGNGVEMYCDGTAVWVVDPAACQNFGRDVKDSTYSQVSFRFSRDNYSQFRLLFSLQLCYNT